ncbi:MAG: recombinase family protein, partial [Clostridia bacterium]
MSNNFFYMRVSTKERNQELAIKDRQQTFDRQKGILQKAGYELTDDNTFAERISGKTNASDRQEFEKMLTLLEENDWVVFTETSRFSRSYVLGMEMLDTLIFDKKVNVRFVSNGIELCAN